MQKLSGESTVQRLKTRQRWLHYHQSVHRILPKYASLYTAVHARLHRIIRAHPDLHIVCSLQVPRRSTRYSCSAYKTSF